MHRYFAPQRLFISFLIITIAYTKGFSQGCSDAGVCTIASSSLYTTEQKAKHNIELSQGFGLGEVETYINITSLAYTFSLPSHTVISLKLPYTIATGELGTNQGIGDITLSVSQSFKNEDKNQAWMFTAAGKLKTNNANASIDGKSLPMPYQTSTGTNDMLLAVTYTVNKWLFFAGYQHPFKSNGNEFSRAEWVGNQTAQSHFESTLLKRGDDIALRVQRSFALGDLSLSSSVLAIIRPQEDEMLVNNVYEPIMSTNGLTINLTGTVQYPLSETLSLKGDIGFPVYQARVVRADGLKRSYVLSVGLAKSF